MKKIGCFLLAVLLILSVPSTAFAHSGRLDANGGHYNRKTGTYHYHRGTGSSSVSSSSGSYSSGYYNKRLNYKRIEKGSVLQNADYIQKGG